MNFATEIILNRNSNLNLKLKISAKFKFLYHFDLVWFDTTSDDDHFDVFRSDGKDRSDRIFFGKMYTIAK